MRLLLLVSVVLLAAGVLAWDQFDYEIFDLWSAVETAEGEGATFYSFLNVTSSATAAEISKQYRRRSLELHPDKNRNVKGAQERFARLGVIANILRDDTQRKRYDYFYKNGVPKWRGTGYYYSRYRPGIALVVIGLALASCGVQYIVQRLNYFVAKQRLDNFRRRAIRQAYGDVAPGKVKEQKRLRLRIPKTELAEDRHNAFLISVHGENIYLIDEDSKEEHLLDDSQLPPVGFRHTWLPSLLLSLVPSTGSKVPIDDSQSHMELEPAKPAAVAPAVETSQTQSTTKKRKGGKR